MQPVNVGAAITNVVQVIVNWVRVFSGLGLAIIVLLIVAEMLGFHPPYFPHVGADQNTAWVLIACAFAMGARL